MTFRLTEKDLRFSPESTLEGKQIRKYNIPVQCNIKWKKTWAFLFGCSLMYQSFRLSSDATNCLVVDVKILQSSILFLTHRKCRHIHHFQILSDDIIKTRLVIENGIPYFFRICRINSVPLLSLSKSLLPISLARSEAAESVVKYGFQFLLRNDHWFFEVSDTSPPDIRFNNLSHLNCRD